MLRSSAVTKEALPMNPIPDFRTLFLLSLCCLVATPRGDGAPWVPESDAGPGGVSACRSPPPPPARAGSALRAVSPPPASGHVTVTQLCTCSSHGRGQGSSRPSPSAPATSWGGKQLGKGEESCVLPARERSSLVPFQTTIKPCTEPELVSYERALLPQRKDNCSISGPQRSRGRMHILGSVLSH